MKILVAMVLISSGLLTPTLWGQQSARSGFVHCTQTSVQPCRSLGYVANDRAFGPPQLVGPLLSGGYVSSGFGIRVHPIRKFLLMHWGVDIAAPLGTPIYAIGDAVVLEVTSDTPGGNCLKLRHSRVYASAYCHLLLFASGIRVGAKVRRGEVIGFVGSTGESTGPHLHWELFVRNVRVEPVCACATTFWPSGSALDSKTQNKPSTVLQSTKDGHL